ncbi:MAG: hypothetical protein Q3M24_13290 [Candidatus Electrothrix aestuarii]|uniref:Outer membrane protein beta-barrel domain-containing protein n=1 Tax=Candidatus Electrothrix aestuarii TaxID=3062594 RepID=A0AAU8LQI6_9BACT|nr:hypothetical protein [Candidatus Electrothrix aestuarii]
MRKLYTFLAVSSFLALSSPVYAESGQFGLGIKGGTQGVGLELSMDVNSYIEVRAGINQISFDFDTTIGDIDYNFAPDFFTSSLLLDLHPFGNAFRFTVGTYINKNEIDVDGTYRQDLLSPELSRYADLIDQAHVVGTVEFETFAPYLGIGWTSNHYSESRWGVNIDLGIMFQGSPQVTELHVEDPWGVGDHPVAEAFAEQERQEIEKEIDEYEYYPVASLTLSYKF